LLSDGNNYHDDDCIFGCFNKNKFLLNICKVKNDIIGDIVHD